MTATTSKRVSKAENHQVPELTRRTVDRFAKLVVERVETLAHGTDRFKIIALAEQAVREARATIALDVDPGMDRLPVERLKAGEVIAQKLVDLSPASLYRGVDSKRFYCTTPNGRSIGREFPAWQFVYPVPEMLEAVLRRLDSLSSGEVHAFWVTACDELNELAPAEALAGKPFTTRAGMHPSQEAMLAQPAAVRLRQVLHVAGLRTKGMAEIIG